MARRKTWEQLSPAYRSRLERKGITAEQHRTGANLAPARGHISPTHEAEGKKYRRDLADYIYRQSFLYGRDEEEIREALHGHTKAEIRTMIADQTDSETLYDVGQQPEAHAIWQVRNSGFPEWTHYYHGTFS